ncbi:hypothetical protein [Shewanella sediminis]|uniref:hypothetical protein n=1 Tax=Shewanella sediminis TaxID=271097 RepID=UPI0002E0A13F|nr:hypothetical protein [Shewanella sediminis]
MDINAKDAIYLATQAIIVATMIGNNRSNIAHLKQQNDELKSWLKKLQDRVNDIRVKVGI